MRVGTLLVVSLWMAAAPSRAAEVDRRSHELIRRECRAVIDVEDVTMFANGTVRLIARHEEEKAARGREEGCACSD